jgi:hypothetical protein
MALSGVQLMARASEVLIEGGYQYVSVPATWPSGCRVFEDPFGIVALNVYETWQQLRDEWNDAQGLLVDLISENVSRPEPKAWEGYLVLLTPGGVVDSDRQDLVDLRYNTNRVRKLVATGYEIETLDDVRSALLPLLPLNLDRPSAAGTGLLDRLPELLSEDGIDSRATAAAIDAFVRNESIMEGLHNLGGES